LEPVNGIWFIGVPLSTGFAVGAVDRGGGGGGLVSPDRSFDRVTVPTMDKPMGDAREDDWASAAVAFC